MTHLRWLVVTASLVAIASSALVLEKANLPGSAPATLVAQSLTPADMDAGIVAEKRAAEYARAERAAQRILVENGCNREYASLAGHAAFDNGLSPRLVAAVLFVESSCRASAISSEGAIGAMQVNPRVWHYTRSTLLNPRANVQIGTRILAQYVHKYGVREGLHRYNGLGNVTDDYPERVLRVAHLS